MLRRKDNLKKVHFPNHHPEITNEDEMYLKIGDVPSTGRDHVVNYLDLIESKTPWPAELQDEEELNTQVDPAEKDSQDIYDELTSEHSSEDEE